MSKPKQQNENKKCKESIESKEKRERAKLEYDKEQKNTEDNMKNITQILENMERSKKLEKEEKERKKQETIKQIRENAEKKHETKITENISPETINETSVYKYILELAQISEDIGYEPNQRKDAKVLYKSVLLKTLLDMSYSIELRIKCMLAFYRKFPNELMEIVKHILDSYTISNTFLHLEYVIAICREKEIDLIIRIECAKVLATCNPIGYEILNEMFRDEIRTNCKISNSYKTQILLLLFEQPTYRDNIFIYIREMVNNAGIPCDFRYKLILNLEQFEGIESKLFDIQMSFLSNTSNDPTFRILSAQYLFSKYKKMDKKSIETIENILLSIAQGESIEIENEDIIIEEVDEKEVEYEIITDENQNLDKNIRADATDVLLTYGRKKTKAKAIKIITELGVGSSQIKNIYTNSQNVHNKSITKSAGRTLDFLHTVENKDREGNVVSLIHVCNCIKRLIKNNDKITTENKKKVIAALGRVNLDRATYSKYNMKISAILIKVWCYINQIDEEEKRKEMENRLLEELIESCGTCSSGYVERLVNVLSGFTDLGINISFEDQIIANFTARLNARIMNLKNEKVKNLAFEEMTLPISKHWERRHLSSVFRKFFPEIREELRKEFLEYISEQEFEMALRKAISQYEGTGRDT